MLTRDQVQQITGDADRWLVALNNALIRWDVDTPTRVAMFLAQCAHESAGFTHLVENLHYSANALMRTWPSRFPPDDATRMAYDERAIAERAYGGRMGNGPEGSGDGYRFRGRGIIQLTGRENYQRCGQAIGLDFVESPELLEQPQWAAQSAGWFWATHGCNELADVRDFTSITKRINGGLNGQANRETWLASVRAILGATPQQQPQPATPAPPQPASAPAPQPEAPMGFVAALLPTILELFSGRAAAAAQKISGAPPDVASKFIEDMSRKVIDLSGQQVTDQASALKAVSAVVNDSAKMQELQDHALDYLEKVAPFLDKIATYEQAEWTASEASVKAAAARNAESKDIPLTQDRAFLVSVFILVMVAMVVLSVLWKDAIVSWLGLKDITGFSTDMQSFVIGAIVGSALTAVIAYFLGSTKQSAAKDAAIETLSRATKGA